MSTVIYPSPVFGPVHSRRLGVSLGINLLPSDGKVCSFDCIYCECGYNASHRAHAKLPTAEEVRQTLESRLKEMKEHGPAPDVLPLPAMASLPCTLTLHGLRWTWLPCATNIFHRPG